MAWSTLEKAAASGLSPPGLLGVALALRCRCSARRRCCLKRNLMWSPTHPTTSQVDQRAGESNAPSRRSMIICVSFQRLPASRGRRPSRARAVWCRCTGCGSVRDRSCGCCREGCRLSAVSRCAAVSPGKFFLIDLSVHVASGQLRWLACLHQRATKSDPCVAVLLHCASRAGAWSWCRSRQTKRQRSR